MTEPQQNSERSLSKSEPEYAGFWMRLLAFLIDVVLLKISLIIIFVLLLCLLNLCASASLISTDWLVKLTKNPEHTLAIELISIFVFYWLYYALMESSDGQATLGKRICRLKLARKDGARLSFGRASARFWTRMVHVSVFCGLGLLVEIALTCLTFGIVLYLFHMFYLGVCLFMLFVFSFAGYLPALCTARRQTLHDLMAGTVVVKAN